MHRRGRRGLQDRPRRIMSSQLRQAASRPQVEAVSMDASETEIRALDPERRTDRSGRGAESEARTAVRNTPEQLHSLRWRNATRDSA